MRATEILPGLYLGAAAEAYYDKKEGLVDVALCVTERSIANLGLGTDWYEIMSFLEEDDENVLRADVVKLHTISMYIKALLEQKKKIVVFCGVGSERSPLAVVWYLHNFEDFSLNDAYEFVKRKRSIVIDRTDWLPGKYKAGID